MDFEAPQTGAPGDALHFTDFNLKLAVIEQLMYQGDVLTPRFDLRAFAAGQPEGTIDLEADAPIPAAVQWFERLTITAEDASRVTELVFDGGNEVYRQLMPRWDGEDGTFDVASWDDLALLPSLERVVLLMTEDPDSVAEAIEARGIEVEL